MRWPTPRSTYSVVSSKPGTRLVLARLAAHDGTLQPVRMAGLPDRARELIGVDQPRRRALTG